ncbi:DUF1684 domain-containing protein [Spirosoma validum]|uniref:DUF1684 domain-containing protein n=1 Tax=Spirosoma validum TaxID=2771355 RepID=A0A927B099_9BACT|nr:DUF1684 domain-containing protein [Spirosoma validum]MBD2753170.1 DUF1684 domain-containing protein [Spirosoma validum]
MKRAKRSPKALNPYSSCFFGLWLLTMISIVGFRQIADSPAYKAQIEEWHQKRVNSLKSENGWLNLAGLFWLKEGKNSLGRGSDFDVPFPAANASTELGVLELNNGEVRFEPKFGADVSVDGKSVTEPLVVFSADNKPAVLANGSLRWVTIKRGDKYGIRLRDLDSPLLKEFHSIDRFPVDESWRIKAKLEKPSTPKIIPIINVLGQVTQTPLVGTLVFEKGGKTYRLDAVGEEEKLFILFGDPTNAHNTYGAGRFLYADKADSEGVTTLDFNQAINPPCAFTTYATCPLPPKQNKLTLAVTAGEKRYGDH